MEWGLQSANSIAMGYEVAVTPVQLASAYAVFANGGRLIEPTLVKEVRTPDGAVRYHHQPRVVRQVVSNEVASTVREMLKEVVKSGTASDAEMETYVLAGKTGTPRGTVNGKYVTGRYNPNFVGLFPADDPQYVIVVRISNPSGSIYGGKTAAPVTKAVIEAAVASPRAVLDRGRLAATALPAISHPTSRPGLRVTTGAELAGETLSTNPPPAVAVEPVVVALPAVDPAPAPRTVPRQVPDIRGMSVRDAVRTLHRAGFHVGYSSASSVTRAPAATWPAAGSFVRQGTLVRLIP
jgi:cell division protein FtsI (penicillin-binding protein 3)